MQNDLISRSALIAHIGDLGSDPEDDTTLLTMGQACAITHKCIVYIVKAEPAVDAVEVTAQELQFLIDAMYRHIRWMIAGRLDKPECSYDERVALLERLTLFEREHFPDMQAEAEG